MIREAEAIILIFIAVFGDLAEILGAALFAIAFVGIPIWLYCLFMGFIASTTLFTWSFLRTTKGHRAGKILARRVMIMIISVVIDEITGGPLPMKTIGIITTILVNNHYAKNDEKGIEKTAKSQKALLRAAKLVIKYGKYLGI